MEGSSSRPYCGNPYQDYLTASSAPRILTSAVELKALRTKYPDRSLTIVNSQGAFMGSSGCDLIGFANSGAAKAVLSPESESILERIFSPPARRYGGDDEGQFAQVVQFAAYDYEFKEKTFLIYVAYCHDGYISYRMNFILGEPGSKKADSEPDSDADELVEAATMWGIESHDEVWVFDRGMWQKDKELWKVIQKSSWDDVILDKEKKQALIDDVDGFFDGEQSYKEFAVPWKVCFKFYNFRPYIRSYES